MDNKSNETKTTKKLNKPANKEVVAEVVKPVVDVAEKPTNKQKRRHYRKPKQTQKIEVTVPSTVSKETVEFVEKESKKVSKFVLFIKKLFKGKKRK